MPLFSASHTREPASRNSSAMSAAQGRFRPRSTGSVAPPPSDPPPPWAMIPGADRERVEPANSCHNGTRAPALCADHCARGSHSLKTRARPGKVSMPTSPPCRRARSRASARPSRSGARFLALAAIIALEHVRLVLRCNAGPAIGHGAGDASALCKQAQLHRCIDRAVFQSFREQVAENMPDQVLVATRPVSPGPSPASVIVRPALCPGFPYHPVRRSRRATFP